MKKEQQPPIDPVELAIAINKRSNDILMRTLQTEELVLRLQGEIVKLERKLNEHMAAGRNPHEL